MSSYQTDAVNQLAEKLVDISPGNLTKVHPKVSSGSAAKKTGSVPLFLSRFFTEKSLIRSPQAPASAAVVHLPLFSLLLFYSQLPQIFFDNFAEPVFRKIFRKYDFRNFIV